MAAGTRRSTINKRRKGALSVLVPWFKRFGIILGFLALSLWIGSWLYLSGGLYKAKSFSRSEMKALTASMGFEVTDILVEGRVHANPDKLRMALNAKKGTPLFSFDPKIAREKIESLDWVKSANVERRLPGTIYLRLTEHQPLAFWQKDKKLFLLDEASQAI
jgi:cell division protein FtsQ